MEDSKETMLATMYALRAGISQISLEQDRVNDMEAQAKEECKPILKRAKQSKAGVNKKSKEIERREKEIEKHRRVEGKMVQLRALKKSIARIRLFVTLGLLCLIGILYALLLGKDAELSQQSLFFGAAAVLFLAVVIAVWRLTERYYDNACSNRIDKGHETWNYQQTRWRERDFQRESAELEELRGELQRQEREFADCQAEAREAEENAKHAVLPYYLRADAVYAGLLKEFSAFLDERDWENLDLIIYALETGRADSLKEALHFIDEERRANQLVTAVNQAAEQISQTIHIGFQRMAQAMTMCFDRLSAQIQANAAKQQEQMSAINERFAHMSSQLGSMVEGVDYQNALLKKQNETSEKMMREIRPFLKNANMLMAGELGVHYTGTIYS